MCLEKLRNIKQRNKHDITYLKAKRNELTVICNIQNILILIKHNLHIHKTVSTLSNLSSK